MSTTEGDNPTTIKIDVVIRLINAHWRFTEDQEPMSSWHEKQDLLDLLRNMKDSLPSVTTKRKNDMKAEAVDLSLKVKRGEMTKESWIKNVMRIYPEKTRKEAEALHQKLF